MQRIRPVEIEMADGETKVLLEEVKTKMGMIPNIVSTMARSPVVAKAYLDFNSALGRGTISPRLREQISLAVGEVNQCNYCVSAHSTLAKQIGISEEQTKLARQGSSDDVKEEAALKFAQKIVRDRARLSDEDIIGLREVGFSDGEINEIVGNVALNMFTNYFNEIAGTQLDFPAAVPLAV